jgi:hypothetical protein
MSGEVATIGRCRGCDKTAKLEDQVCTKCLTNPKRMAYPGIVETDDGRKLTGARAWAEIAFRIRTEPEFHLLAYQQLKTPIAQTIFIGEYGFPPGAVPNDELVQLIRSNPAASRHPKLKAFLESLPEDPEEPRPALQLVR